LAVVRPWAGAAGRAADVVGVLAAAPGAAAPGVVLGVAPGVVLGVVFGSAVPAEGAYVVVGVAGVLAAGALVPPALLGATLLVASRPFWAVDGAGAGWAAVVAAIVGAAALALPSS
jgi:hypothetical protein